MSQHLTLLGLGAMAFYAVMLATDNVSLELMPQFLTSAIIFLSSGRIMKMAARSLSKDEEENELQPRRETDWPWLTALLNWNAVLVLIGIMAIFLMKPAGVSLLDALSSTLAPATFSVGAVP